MPNRRSFLALFALSTTPAFAQQPPIRLAVVATFSILGDIVAAIGGERVNVTTLVGPDGDAHVYQPTPADARALAGARVVFVNGLGFEGWITRLVRSSTTRATVVTATRGIVPLKAEGGHSHGHGHGHSHGEHDPHIWQNPLLVRAYAENIRDALIAADPEGAETYRANAATYIGRLEALDAEIKTLFAHVPADRRRVLIAHDAFQYFEKAYGFEFIAPRGVSTDAEPSAQQVARLIRQIRERRIAAVFMENVTDPRLVRRIAEETGARVGGSLFSDALSPPGGPAATYLDLIRHNARTLAEALGATN